MNEDFLKRKLSQRRDSAALRELGRRKGAIDFCSNDYLGIVTNRLIKISHDEEQEKFYGSTGSRLISGNYPFIEEVEEKLARFHHAEAALLFNSGYDANLGLLGSVPQRHDTILYDELSHASIRDGIRLSHAFSFSFTHNDVEDLERRLQVATGNIFVVTESIFSMDGDVAPLQQIIELCEFYGASLILDEAHATGVVGELGEGVAQALKLHDKCFARIYTFGKALGCHGALICGSAMLKQYLINFCRPFIYSTGMPASAVKAIESAYNIFPLMTAERERLKSLVTFFRDRSEGLRLCRSVTPIQGVIIPGNEQVKEAALRLQEKTFDVRPILYPTVPKGMERLRIVLHSYNTEEQVDRLIEGLVM